MHSLLYPDSSMKTHSEKKSILRLSYADIHSYRFEIGISIIPSKKLMNYTFVGDVTFFMHIIIYSAAGNSQTCEMLQKEIGAIIATNCWLFMDYFKDKNGVFISEF